MAAKDQLTSNSSMRFRKLFPGIPVPFPSSTAAFLDATRAGMSAHTHTPMRENLSLKGMSHEIDFKNFDKKLQNLAYLRDAAGF